MTGTPQFQSTFEYKLIYIFRINDPSHKGLLKIGDATVYTTTPFEQLTPSCHELNVAAKKRIDSYTSTAGIEYELLYTELARFRTSKGKIKAFRDYNVHSVLLRSGFGRKYFDTEKKQNEWFHVDLQTAINAIAAVKQERISLDPNEKTQKMDPIIFRPEQKEAIKKTEKQFKVANRMLWNAKMRFGKTLTALQVAKDMGFERTIIITHRPVVSDGWYEDFNKIFYDTKDYAYGSKTKGETIESLVRSGKKFVYFASMQDLRGTDIVGGNFSKNDAVFAADWDFVVIDEAHEGTQTKLGKSVLEQIEKPLSKHTTKVLELSGTPFNRLTDYEEDSIYTWDYIMEQEAKEDWMVNHYGDSNPYEELPKMHIFTYHLEKELTGFVDVDDKAFNFREFFRVWTGDVEKDGKRVSEDMIGSFVHEDDVKSFLDLICKENVDSNYPYSKQEYREYFRHSLWMLPGVKEAKALSKLMSTHHAFGDGSGFKIVNVAGDGDEEEYFDNALKKVREAIDDPSNSYTITLSCGRLTTGVSVPEWTAVMMLSGSYSTAASQYLQTIFRVQTPANIDGRIKENCYVFDFAPDRTLKMVAESVQLSSRSSKQGQQSEIQLGKFLNFCPVISIESTSMTEYNVNHMLQELKKAYTERVVKNGFDDVKLYNDELLKLDEMDLSDFDNLKKIIGSSKPTKGVEYIDINDQGFTDEEYEVIDKAKKKKKKELSEEELQLLEELKEKKKNKANAISILRGISIRIPLMVYGVNKDIDVDVTVDNFADPEFIDDLSWEEFMPNGVTREIFKKFSKYYDKDIFVSASRRIRNISKSADELEPTERVKKIVTLFSSFKNPDKETVLTPWKVVNMHLSNCLGGYDFFDERHEKMLDEPRFVEHGEITLDTLGNKSAKILEINSKTGLYPLYATYSIYRAKCNEKGENLSFDEKIALWDEAVEQNIFVVCKTPMAKSITKRTLVGYRNVRPNTRYYEDLINQLKQVNKLKNFITNVKKGKSKWKSKGASDDMKFNAVIGNPPYQLMDGGAQASATPIYNYFVDCAKGIEPNYVSMIIPSRWMAGGKGLDDFRDEMIHDKHIAKLHDYINTNECFTNVDIKGGVCYFLWDKDKEGPCEIFTHNNGTIVSDTRYLAAENDDVYIRYPELLSIKNKIEKRSSEFFDSIVSARKPYLLPGDFFKDPSKYGYPPIFNDPIPGGYKIIGLEKLKRVLRYIPKNYPLEKTTGLDKYKVFIPESFGAGYLGEGPASPFIAKPGELCTETFLQIGPFDTEMEAASCLSYIKTKFWRIAVGIRKNTQHGTQKVYRSVPLMTFDRGWTDEELYKLFDLNDKEIEFVKTMTAPYDK
ncbi:Eco57I restriction-modification methylase domain-containing protein [Candidatus Methanarcanum hacksteinii]|uniref:Eco57I restriction-modification methylase domain-containing protein n=1 Tax=Candidatus Methanarcanum hacksteinii TaxID=2911857 RepID=UPI0037DCDF95